MAPTPIGSPIESGNPAKLTNDPPTADAWIYGPFIEWSAFQRSLPRKSNVSKTKHVMLTKVEGNMIRRVLKEQANVIPLEGMSWLRTKEETKITPRRQRKVLYAMWEAGYSGTDLFKRIALA